MAPTLELLDAVVLPPAPPGDPARGFGSLSGLVGDGRTGRYLAVIDDRQPSRMAWLEITFADGRLTVRRLGVEPIQPGPGTDARRVTGADLEAVVALPDGTFVAVEEGHRSTGARGQPPAGEWPVGLLTLEPTGVVTRIDDWPKMFDLGREAGGIRDNQGAEALTRTPDGRLIAGLEQPRHADLPTVERNGRPFGGGRGGPGRLVEFTQAEGAWTARRQWVYPISPTPLRPGFDTICDDGENGLTELLALDDERFLALERSCLMNGRTRLVRNTVGIYLVDVSAATDASGTERWAAGLTLPARKTLLLDLDELIPQLPPELARLENFEGLAFGPPLPDGSRTILVMSDDNFRATQRTVFLLLRLRWPTSASRLPSRRHLPIRLPPPARRPLPTAPSYPAIL